ncbi:MAG: GTP 3',8-cyclase MoaA, partial [Nitrososphaerota archaeon]|nr:GTP 3',8-cyclase MoaA [Nitrososphaerota archaeon]
MRLCDNFGRPLLNLRISVTQRCDYACTYCHREGEFKHADSYSSTEDMTSEEIVRIAELAIDLGITRV